MSITLNVRYVPCVCASVGAFAVSGILAELYFNSETETTNQRTPWIVASLATIVVGSILAKYNDQFGQLLFRRYLSVNVGVVAMTLINLVGKHLLPTPPTPKPETFRKYTANRELDVTATNEAQEKDNERRRRIMEINQNKLNLVSLLGGFVTGCIFSRFQKC